ncbi:hypothetical protein VCUG_00012 [Vavraia culicis subsp. floridensis]|uniref:Uncharacterized protein n=1 Tax=Vavraia culicis (isolate floridensis) TaxID=948595 RepID=L2GYR6_VAVCU|nr:uncharacterized protein VCUG_00012 [Vavraia culicis subsp. floridensis]ELA48403.1 hypothetical protein VCUG_00012 [Vavraia culicis subsp. floridensis]
MPILSTTLPLIPTSVKLSFLVRNMVNRTLQSLNEHLDIVNREELHEYLVHKSKVLRMLAYIDVLKYYKQKRRPSRVADEMADWFEEMKILFCAKCDFRSALSVYFYGYEGIVSNALIEMLRDDDSSGNALAERNVIKYTEEQNDVLVDRKAESADDLSAIDTLIRIYLTKEDVSIFKSIEIENGVLTLASDHVTFKLTLCGSHTSPTWTILSPPNINLHFHLLPVYVKKIEVINRQRRIFETYKDIATGTFYDFEIRVFEEIVLKIKDGTGIMKAFGEKIHGGLDIHWYMRWIEKWFIGEISNRYEYLKMRYRLWFVIGEGLHLVEENEHTEQPCRFIGGLDDKYLSSANTFYDNREETGHVLFKSLKDFRRYFVNHERHPFYTALLSIAKRNNISVVRNYQEKDFGTRNVFLRRDANFVCIRCDDNSHRIFVGRNVKYNLLRYIELGIVYNTRDKSAISAQDINDLEDNFSDLNVRSGCFLTNTADNRYAISLSHVKYFLRDIDLLMMVNDILYLQETSVTVSNEIKFLYNMDRYKFKIKIKSDEDCRMGTSQSDDYDQKDSTKEENGTADTYNDVPRMSKRKRFVARIAISNQSMAEIKIYEISNLLNYLTISILRDKLSKYGIKGTFETAHNRSILSFMFYNLSIRVVYDGRLSIQCTNTLLVDLLKCCLTVDLISHLRALKLVLKENLVPISFNSNYLLFKYGKTIVFKYYGERYYCAIDGGYKTVDEKIVSEMKNMEVGCKMDKIWWCLHAYENKTKIQVENTNGDTGEDRTFLFATEVGEFRIYRQRKSIILRFTRCELRDEQKVVLEKLFYNIFNFENYFTKYMDVLVHKNKAVNVIENLSST